MQWSIQVKLDDATGVATVTECKKLSPTAPVPSTPPQVGTKVFPDWITFEASSDVATDQYAGKAVILLPASWLSKVKSLTLNGEQAFIDVPYKGIPVFRFTKNGNDYARPLKVVITAVDGTVYTATTGNATTPSGSGKNVETSNTSAWANGNRDHFRLSKSGSSYGSNITLEFSNGYKVVVPNGAVRKEWSDGTLWKPISDSNGKAVVLGPRNIHIASVTVRY